MTPLVELVARHKSGQHAGIYSLCSAHPLVIESALCEARASGTPLLVEATSNQVNQFGGYTGLTPAGFRAFVHDIAGRVGYPADRVWLGGDHLGPNAWRQEVAATAMGRAEELVALFVTAGFRKLHLDCSMSCADDPSPLPEATVAGRAARLCAAAERAWREHGGDAPAYVIGTEVPAPGGAGEELLALTVTTPEAAQATIEAHRGAFEAADLAAAWPRSLQRDGRLPSSHRARLGPRGQPCAHAFRRSRRSRPRSRASDVSGSPRSKAIAWGGRAQASESPRRPDTRLDPLLPTSVELLNGVTTLRD